MEDGGFRGRNNVESGELMVKAAGRKKPERLSFMFSFFDRLKNWVVRSAEHYVYGF